MSASTPALAAALGDTKPEPEVVYVVVIFKKAAPGKLMVKSQLPL